MSTQKDTSVHRVSTINPEIFTEVRRILRSLPIRITKLYNGEERSVHTVQRFRAAFLHNYTPQVFLAAVLHARIREIEQFPGDLSAPQQQAFQGHIENINQELATTFNDLRDEERNLGPISMIAGYFLHVAPNTVLFAGSRCTVNTMPSYVTSSEIAQWIKWPPFAQMFNPLVYDRGYSAGEVVRIKIRCMSAAVQLLYSGHLDVWNAVCAAVQGYQDSMSIPSFSGAAGGQTAGYYQGGSSSQTGYTPGGDSYYQGGSSYQPGYTPEGGSSWASPRGDTSQPRGSSSERDTSRARSEKSGREKKSRSGKR